MRSQDHSLCCSRVVQGERLPKIDDDVDTVLGLAVFYQHVLSAALNQQQTQCISVFNSELLARYLHVGCLSVTNCHESTEASLLDEIRFSDISLDNVYVNPQNRLPPICQHSDLQALQNADQ